MAFPGLPRRAVWFLWAALLAPLPLAAQAPADAAAVRSLIVRLKDAPSHVELAARPVAGLREQPLAAPVRERERARRQRVLGEAGLDSAAGAALRSLRPVGRDQLLLTLAAPVTAGQAQAIVERLAARPEVDWVQVNTRDRRLQLPDDYYFQTGAQWWLLPATGTDANGLTERRRGVPGFQTAWLRPGGTGSPTAVVAVLDTGITPHPELEGRVLPGYDFVADLKFGADGDGRDADPLDPGDGVTLTDLADPHFQGCAVSRSSWHGTVIAGLAAARTNDANGVAAIHWDGRILPVRVAGKCGADVTDIVEGMRWAVGLPACRRDDGAGTCLEFAPLNPNPARIVNISFGSGNACGAAYQSAVNDLKAANAVVIAAAGNEHASTPTRPANCRDVIGVAGLARDGYKTHYSNFGNALAATGIATVSGDDDGDATARWNVLADEGILSIGNDDSGVPGYYYFWGTSFSAPLVSGAVSLMLSVNPSLSYAQIVDGLRRTARPHVTSPLIGSCSDSNPGRCVCTTATCGVGILDAEQAVLYATDPAAYVQPAWPLVLLESADIAAAAALGPDRVANVTPQPSPPSGGGGAWSLPWLLALGLAAWALSARGAGGGRLRRR